MSDGSTLPAGHIASAPNLRAIPTNTEHMRTAPHAHAKGARGLPQRCTPAAGGARVPNRGQRRCAAVHPRAVNPGVCVICEPEPALRNEVATSLVDGYSGPSRCETPHTTPQCEQLLMGMIGFDIGRRPRGSGPRMQSYLVNALCKPIGADSKRTDFALAA